MSTDPLVQAFLEEAAELVADFESGLLRLEDTPDDPDLLNRIFRSAHTLKGNSAMLGFDSIARFTHTLEDLLDQLRKGKRAVTRAVIDTLLASSDVVRTLLDRARDGSASSADEESALERVLDGLKALVKGEPLAEAAPRPVVAAEPVPAPVPAAPPAPAAAPGARTLYEIRFRPPRDLLRRGLDPIQLVGQLGELGELVRVDPELSALPPLAELEPEASYLAWTLWLVSDRPRAEVEARFDFVGDPAAVAIDPLPLDDGPVAPAAAEAEETVAVPEAAPAVQTGAYTGPDRRHPEPATSVEGAETIIAAKGYVGPDRRRGSAPAPSGGADAASIRVPVERVDRLINLVGELVITQSMVAQTLADFTPEKLTQLREAVAQMDRHARQLHERMMAIRMVPVRTLFGRFPRLVRDLSGAAGKQVTLEVSGEDTELDKTVIEKIGDPLTHLVRNSVDHGIEPPEARLAAGKPETGTVRLDAYQQGGSIYIEVSDDGRGLDRERILNKAIQNGLVTADQVLADEDVFALIFQPGLSTAEKVTEVSGRGVGMDVVRRNVEALSGTITISSEWGRGTRFRIKLPLTLAILDGQLLRVGAESYVLPLVSIVESVLPRPETLTRVLGRGEALTVRGQALPLLRLHRMFDVEGAAEDATQGIAVIVEHDGLRVALLVDELMAQQQVVVKSLELNFRRVDGVAGATILGDGRVSLILDVPGLVALATAGRTVNGTAPGPAPEPVSLLR